MNHDYRDLGSVKLQNSGERVDFYLAKNFPFQSRHAWKKKLKSQELLINNQPVKASYRLKLEDQICYYAPLASEPHVNKDIRIVWQIENLAAIYKPPKLPMHEGGAYRLNTFQYLINKKLGPEWAAMHRLDRETSGLVLCSDRSDFRAKISQDFFQHKISKEYLAIAQGQAKSPRWLTDLPLGEESTLHQRNKVVVSPQGKDSKTKFELIEQHESACLLRVRPLSGRTHQIRVHAAANNLPLVGDTKYTKDDSIYNEYLTEGFTKKVKYSCWFDRLCLHAASIQFYHPKTGDLHKVSIPIPEDMETIWEEIKRSNI